MIFLSKITRRWEWLVIAGQVQFFILSITAMIFYGGGSTKNPFTQKYRYFENFFSDLGRTVSLSGEPNTLSLIIFTISLAFLGLSQLVFYVNFRLNRLPIAFGIGRTLGALSSLGIVFTALTPVDIAKSIHTIAVAFWIVPFFLATSFYAYFFLKNEWPIYIVIFTGMLSFSSLLHIIQIGVIHAGGAATVQKLVVNSLLAWFCLCSFQHTSYKPEST